MIQPHSVDANWKVRLPAETAHMVYICHLATQQRGRHTATDRVNPIAASSHRFLLLHGLTNQL